MTPASDSSRITRVLLAIAAAISVLAYVNWGAERGLAATVGAGVSLANWFALRWLGLRIMSGQGPAKALVSLLAIGKIGLLMAIVYVLINTLHLDPVGLCLGLAVLFIGPVVGGLLAATSSPAQPNTSAASVANEER
jgi:hypothetical protein